MLVKVPSKEVGEAISRGLWGDPVGQTEMAVPVVRSSTGEWALWLTPGFNWEKNLNVDLSSLGSFKIASLDTYIAGNTRLFADTVATHITGSFLMTEAEAEAQGWFQKTQV